MPNSGGHNLYVSIPLQDYRVKSKDVLFLIYRGKGARSKKFGELRVSQGAVVWRGVRDQIGRKLTWSRFHRLFEKHGTRSETRHPSAKKTVPRGKRN
jgi:hypothetical protein